jgi:hypothetical protein
MLMLPVCLDLGKRSESLISAMNGALVSFVCCCQTVPLCQCCRVPTGSRPHSFRRRSIERLLVEKLNYYLENGIYIYRTSIQIFLNQSDLMHAP